MTRDTYAKSRQNRFPQRNRCGHRTPPPEPDRTVVDLATVRRVPRKRLVPGAVVWAHVPFEDGTGEKTRPAVVVGRQGRRIDLRPCTSSVSRYRFPHRYVELQDPDGAGLGRPTGVARRVVTVDLIEIVDIVGALVDEDELVVRGVGGDGLAA